MYTTKGEEGGKSNTYVCRYGGRGVDEKITDFVDIGRGLKKFD